MATTLHAKLCLLPVDDDVTDDGRDEPRRWFQGHAVDIANRRLTSYSLMGERRRDGVMASVS